MLAVPVLGALALGLPTWQAWRQYAKVHPILAIEVPPAAEGVYGGARWRLTTTTVEAASTDMLGRPIELPPGAVILRARFTLTPGPRTDLEALRLCEGRLRDPLRGVLWNANRLSHLRPASKLPDNCGWSLGDPSNWMDTTERKAKVDEPWAFELTYVIPEAVADRAEPELLLRDQYPRYLRFRR